MAVDTTENVVRGGGDFADGVLIKKVVSEKQKQAVHYVEPETAPATGTFALNRGAGWNYHLLIADQGKVVSSCGTISG